MMWRELCNDISRGVPSEGYERDYLRVALGDLCEGAPVGIGQTGLMKVLSMSSLESKDSLLREIATTPLSTMFAKRAGSSRGLGADAVLMVVTDLKRDGRPIRYQRLTRLVQFMGVQEVRVLIEALLGKARRSVDVASIIADATGRDEEDVVVALAIAGTWDTYDAAKADTLSDISMVSNTHVRPALIGEGNVVYPCLGEVKRDGIRLMLHPRAAYTRGGNDWLERIPSLRAAVSMLPPETIIDGELHGTTDGKPATAFEVMEAIKGNGNTRLVYYAFDILLSNGFDATSLPLRARRKLLFDAIGALASMPLPLPILIEEMEVLNNEKEADLFYKRIIARGHEGIVTKKLDGPYHIGRRDSSWGRRKETAERDLVVVGIVLTGGRQHYRLATRCGTVVGDAIAQNERVDAVCMLALMSHAVSREITETRNGSRLIITMNPVVVVAVKMAGVRRSSSGELTLREGVVMMPRIDKTSDEADVLESLTNLRGA